jgi:hypothetical protein
MDPRFRLPIGQGWKILRIQVAACVCRNVAASIGITGRRWRSAGVGDVPSMKQQKLSTLIEAVRVVTGKRNVWRRFARLLYRQRASLRDAECLL